MAGSLGMHSCAVRAFIRSLTACHSAEERENDEHPSRDSAGRLGSVGKRTEFPSTARTR